MEKRAKLNGRVGTIGLPRSKERVKAGTVCSVAGWGRISTEYLLYPDTLQEVDVVVMQDAKCPKDSDGPYRHYNKSTMMCVGDPAECKDAALGDSGGPLVCGDTAQGIVAGGLAGSGVYTRVSPLGTG
ncbi:mast cell protease 8 [Chelydra serpentina]|uniref:Mast cell protease 8 n=1 Tax=Chelydra serpentina TaxID=8475 RepID=A0A8T1S2R9_CHESE|nr:mast cell protease 8 [Chelydra serpentina]